MTIKENGPHPVDIHVGSRVRLRRTLLGMSQNKLGNALGLTFQQIQKNERGANRIGSSRLYQLSKILDVPISFFFDDMPDNINDPDYVPEKGPSRKQLRLAKKLSLLNQYEIKTLHALLGVLTHD